MGSFSFSEDSCSVTVLCIMMGDIFPVAGLSRVGARFTKSARWLRVLPSVYGNSTQTHVITPSTSSPCVDDYIHILFHDTVPARCSLKRVRFLKII
jgi:hypothetical protein